MSYSDRTEVVVSQLEVARKLRTDYSHGLRDHTTKALEDICELCWELERPDVDVRDFLRKIADLISKNFGIASVSIAVWEPKQEVYQYKVVIGIDQEAIKEFMNIAYTKAQINDTSIYPGHDISSHTKIYLTEEHPYAPGEEISFKRPGLIGLRRRTVTDSLEADYLDFFFYGKDKEILGWLETSGTRLRKLPDAATIRWIELIAVLVGQALQARK